MPHKFYLCLIYIYFPWLSFLKLWLLYFKSFRHYMLKVAKKRVVSIGLFWFCLMPFSYNGILLRMMLCCVCNPYIVIDNHIYDGNHISFISLTSFSFRFSIVKRLLMIRFEPSTSWANAWRINPQDNGVLNNKISYIFDFFN